MNYCRNLAADAAKGRLSREELAELMDDLESPRQGDMFGVMDRGRNIAQEAVLAAMIEKRNRLQNIVVEAKLWSMVEAADGAMNRPDLGLEAAMVGVNTPIEGGLRSVDALTQGIANGWLGGMIADLKAGNLLAQFNTMSGDFSRQVARVLHDLNRAEPKGVDAPADAKAIAKVMHKYQTAARERQNRAGAYIMKRDDGYVVRQTHKPERMAGRRKEWIAMARDKLDFAAMEVAPANIDDFLESAYSAIVSGIRLNTEVSDVARAFKGPGNLAKKASASRTLVFKSPDDWFDYDQAFGNASLREAFLSDMTSAAKRTALMTNFGTNPNAMLDKVIQRAERKYRDDPAKLKQFRGGLVNLQAAMDEVTGDVNIGAGMGIAKYTAAFRAVQTMAKLGGAWVSALSDLAFIAANRKFQGRNIMQSWGDALTSAMKGLQPGEAREFADALGVGLEGQLGDFMSRFNAADQVAGKTSKLMATFFKLNLLGPWTDANKRGVTMMIASDLAKNAGKAFDALPVDMARMMKVYGIDAAKWEIARQAVRKGPDGRDYLFPGDITHSVAKVQDDVRESLFTLLSNEADFSVPSPGARERAIMRRGYRPGTAAGEAIRFVGQFKSFGVTGLTKVMGRQVYGSGSKTLGDQLKKGLGENLGMVNAIAGATVIGYFVLQAKEIMAGREPRPNDYKTMIAALAQGGGFGIYGDFLFGQASRFGGGTLDTLAGPGLGTVAEIVDLLQKAKWGEDHIGADTVRLLKSNIPFANLFYIKGAMDYLVWYQLQEAINPGYLKRMEKRVKRENGQTYWMAPSSVVATGGGFRG